MVKHLNAYLKVVNHSEKKLSINSKETQSHSKLAQDTTRTAKPYRQVIFLLVPCSYPCFYLHIIKPLCQAHWRCWITQHRNPHGSFYLKSWCYMFTLKHTLRFVHSPSTHNNPLSYKEPTHCSDNKQCSSRQRNLT